MKNLTKILLSSIFAINLVLNSLSVLSQDYWLRVPSPTDKWLTRSFLLDTVYGWAAGEYGTIIKTSNGGSNWVVLNSGITEYPIDDIFFINSRLGWALANDYLFQGTFVLKTTNGGNTWSTSRFFDTSVVVTSIYFQDSLNGFFTGFSGFMFKTTDAGASWNECHIDTQYCPILFRFPKNKIDFLNQSTGFACGGHYDIQGIIWKTTDSGLNWFTYCVAPEPLWDIKVINENKIISSGGDYEFGATTSTSYNGGTVWLYDTTNFFGIGADLAFRTAKELWMPLTFAQAFALNLDSGSINSPWYSIPAPDSSSIYTAKFVTPTYGFGFGSYGTIVKYNTAVIGINNGQSQVPVRSRLFQNYPNPFNPATVISYYLAKQEFVKITLYDLLGRQLKVFAEGYRPAGSNNFRFQNFGLASGVYIYKIEAGDFVESKKMVLLK